MKHRWVHLALRPVMALGLAVTPWVVQAQGQVESVQDWRAANETVGQFPRGHADVLHWEQTLGISATTVERQTAAFGLTSAADAVRTAWAAHRELAHPLAQLGQQAAGHVAAGHWGLIDPSLQRRIHGVDKLLEVAAKTRKAWITAVAARETVEHLKNALTAAEAAAELGRRMVRVGNWSRYQQAPFELGESSARMELQRARLTAEQAEWALLKTMGLDMADEQVAVPDRLPDMPGAMLSAEELNQRLTALQRHLPVAESRRSGTNARRAYAVYAASMEAYHSYRGDVLKQREIMSEETLLRYNGMLESTWGLLTDAGARSQAVVAAIDARRTALIAETDLLWVLQGGHPEAFVTLGAGVPGAATPGH